MFREDIFYKKNKKQTAYNKRSWGKKVKPPCFLSNKSLTDNFPSAGNNNENYDGNKKINKIRFPIEKLQS
jgi:hypothetical protein